MASHVHKRVAEHALLLYNQPDSSTALFRSPAVAQTVPDHCSEGLQKPSKRTEYAVQVAAICVCSTAQHQSFLLYSCSTVSETQLLCRSLRKASSNSAWQSIACMHTSFRPQVGVQMPSTVHKTPAPPCYECQVPAAATAMKDDKCCALNENHIPSFRHKILPSAAAITN